jgi:hypothetical protein
VADRSVPSIDAIPETAQPTSASPPPTTAAIPARRTARADGRAGIAADQSGRG